MSNEREQARQETAQAGEGRWDQQSGEAHGRAAEEANRDAQPGAKGHGDGEIEERPDQVTGPSGVQRPREVSAEKGVYDPGRVGLEEGDDRNPSDPASYGDPADQGVETSRQEPETPTNRQAREEGTGS